MRPAEGGDVGGFTGYDVVGAVATFVTNPDNSLTEIEQITARSLLYDVTFTFNVPHEVYVNDGAPALAALKTQEVNQIAGHEHVQAVRSEQDQDRSSRLMNFLVVTVGDDSQARTDEVRIRMDQIGLPSAFGLIDAAWNRLVALGPAAPIVV